MWTVERQRSSLFQTAPTTWAPSSIAAANHQWNNILTNLQLPIFPREFPLFQIWNGKDSALTFVWQILQPNKKKNNTVVGIDPKQNLLSSITIVCHFDSYLCLLLKEWNLLTDRKDEPKEKSLFQQFLDTQLINEKQSYLRSTIAGISFRVFVRRVSVGSFYWSIASKILRRSPKFSLLLCIFELTFFLFCVKAKKRKRSSNNTHFLRPRAHGQNDSERRPLFTHAELSEAYSAAAGYWGSVHNCFALRYGTDCSTFEVNKRTLSRPIWSQNHPEISFKFPRFFTILPKLMLTIFTTPSKNSCNS